MSAPSRTASWFRWAGIAYCGLLTFALLVPDPAAAFGLRARGAEIPQRGVHLTAFFALGIVASGAQWPRRRTARAAMLVVYALLTESLQYFVPPRTVELLDYAENLLGIGIALLVAHWLRIDTPAAPN